MTWKIYFPPLFNNQLKCLRSEACSRNPGIVFQIFSLNWTGFEITTLLRDELWICLRIQTGFVLTMSKASLFWCLCWLVLENGNTDWFKKSNKLSSTYLTEAHLRYVSDPKRLLTCTPVDIISLSVCVRGRKRKWGYWEKRNRARGRARECAQLHKRKKVRACVCYLWKKTCVCLCL